MYGELMPAAFIKREIRPAEYRMEIRNDPLSPRSKLLVVIHPLEQESFIYRLDEDTRARLHDGTAPALEIQTRAR